MSKSILTGKNPIILSTQDVEERYRFDYWKDVVCNHIINVDCENPRNNSNFFGKIRIERYGDITFSEMRSQSALFIRRAEHIQKHNSDFILLTLRLDSKASKIVDSRRMNIASGDLSLYHGTRKSLLHVNETIEAIVCNIPLKYFDRHINQPEDLHGTLISAQSQLGSLASSYLLSLAATIGKLSEQQRQKVIDNFLQLLSIATEHKDKPKDVHMEAIQTSMVIQIKEFILCNLANQELSPELIANKFRISPRYLYNIFSAEHTTPCQFILDERLNSARLQLLNKKAHRKNVSEIAFDIGFNNVSHFCRQFKRKFHATPSELRNETRAFAD